MQQSQPDQSDLVAFREEIVNHIDQGFIDLRKEIGFHAQMQRGNGIIHTVRRFFNFIFGKPNLESPTTIALDDFEASKAQIESLLRENSLLKLKEHTARTEHEQLLLKLATEKEKAQAHQETLRRNISELQAAVTKSELQEHKYKDLAGTAATLTQNNSDLLKALKTRDDRIANLQMQVDKYREIILKSTGDSSNQIDDAAITATFRGLNKQIQKLVLSKYYTMSKAPPKPHRSAAPAEMDLYRLWELGLDEDGLQRRVRSLLFRCINEYILSRPYFGLDGLDADAEMEAGFESFEGLLRQNSEDPSADITDWRVATLKCVKLLPTHESPIQKQFQEGIFDLLYPLLNMHAEKAQKEKDLQSIQAIMAQISLDACHLILLLRGSKDTYAFEFPELGKPLNVEEAEAEAVEKVKSKSAKEENSEEVVAFALSAALVRYPQHDPQERVVLEKAWVVVED